MCKVPRQFLRRGCGREVAKVYLSVGGSFGAFSQHPELLNGILIICDAPAELAQRLAAKRVDGVYSFSLASGQTLMMIGAHAAPAVQKCLRELPGIGLRQGLGQQRMVGGLAAERLLEDPHFREWLSHLPELLLSTYGTLTDVELIGKAGLAGGTGSRAIIPLVEAISNVLLRKTNAVVSVKFDVLGALTYRGLGRRVGKNAACGTLDIAAYVSSQEHDAREIRRAEFFELSAVGAKRETRDSLVLQREQALNAPEVREVLEREAPNRALDSRCGNMCTQIFDYWSALDPHWDIAPDVAGQYIKECIEALKVLSDKSVRELQYVEMRRQLPQESIEDLAARALGSDANDLYQAAIQPACEVSFKVRGKLVNGSVIDLGAVQAQFSHVPKTVEELRKALMRLRALRESLSEDLMELTERYEELREETQDRERLLWRAICNLHPTGLRGMFAAVRSVEGRIEEFVNATGEYRANQEELDEVTGKIEGLEDALRQVKDEENFLVGKFEYLISRLEPLVQRGHSQRDHAYIESKALDYCLESLWELDRGTSDEALVTLLCTAVERVTLEGLGKIVDAAQPRLEMIAAQIAKRSVAVCSPSWGGKERHDRPLTFHVLPPVRNDEAAALKQLIERADPEALVGFCQSAAAAVNCVDLHVYSVEAPDDLLTGFYGQALVEVIEDRHSALYLPNGLKTVAGMLPEIVDGRLTFKKEEDENEREAA